MTGHVEISSLSNLEAEQALLGIFLTSQDLAAAKRVYDAVSQIIEPKDFFEPVHGELYDAIASVIAVERIPAPSVLKPYLDADAKVSDDMTLMGYLGALVSVAAFPTMAVDLARAIADMSLRRQVIQFTDEMIAGIANLDPGKDIIDEFGSLEEHLAWLRARHVKVDRKRAGQSYLDQMAEAAKRGIPLGVPIALDEIKEVLNEPVFEVGNVYGLLSSSGEGKTSLTLQLIWHALANDHPVCFLSYDQSEFQCVRQMVAQVHQISASRQKEPKLLSDQEWGWIADFGRWIDTKPFEVIKCTTESAAKLKTHARNFLRRHGNGKVPLFLVDHINAVADHDPRAHEGAKAQQKTAVFKQAASELGGPWLILNQRSSAGMKRNNPRPVRGDVYGGEHAIQPYDAMFYLYRFKKHYEERKATASSDSDWKQIKKVFPEAVELGQDLAEIGALKVRFGDPYVRRTLEFEGKYTRYRSMRPEKLQEGLL